MKKILFIAFLLFGFYAVAQVPATDPVVKSITWERQNAPSNPTLDQRYKDLNGDFHTWDGSQWVLENSGGGNTYVPGTGLNLVGSTFNIISPFSAAIQLAIDANTLKNDYPTVDSDKVANLPTDQAATNTTLQNNIDAKITSVVAGTNVTVDNTDPANPIISSSGGGGGTDDQNIENLAVDTGTNILTVGIEGGNSDTVDLSHLDDPGTDDQNASEVTYNNTTSGLAATDVKAAIDEIAATSGTTLNGLSNVTIAAPSQFEVLTYNGATWDNQQVGAASVAYDNTTSGLSATDVQSAINEIVTGSTTRTFESYGAIAGDGLPDDVAYEAAITDNIAGNLNRLTGGGTYNFDDPHSLHLTNDFDHDFDVGTVFTTNTISGILHTASAENRVNRPTFRNITFESTYVSGASVQDLNHPSVVFFGSGQLDTPRFFNCKFTAPDTPMDGLKITNETVTGSGLVRWTKNLLIDGCTTEDTGRMGMEFWTANNTTNDPSLFNTTVINSTFINPGMVETAHAFGISFAGLGHGVYTENNRFYEVKGVGFETVDVGNISHNNNYFYHNGVDTGRMYGSSDVTPITDMNIDGWFEIGTPPAGADRNSYFQNVRRLRINNANIKNGLVFGADGTPSQNVDNVRITNSTILGQNGFSPLNLFGIINDFQLINVDIEAADSGIPAWNIGGDDQTLIKMIGGSVTTNGGLFELNANAGTSMVDEEHVEFDDGTTSVVLNSYYDELPDISSDTDYFLVDNGATKTALAQQDGLTDITSTDWGVLYNHGYTETAGRTNPSLRFEAKFGTYLTTTELVWDRDVAGGFGDAALYITGTRGTNFNKASAAGSGTFKIENGASVKFKGFDMYNDVGAGYSIYSTSAGTSEQGCIRCEFVDLNVLNEGDAVLLVNTFYYNFQNNLFKSREGTAVELRNESGSTAYNNSTSMNNWYRFGTGIEDAGLRVTSTTPVGQRTTLSNFIGDHFQAYNQAADNDGTALDIDAGTNLRFLGCHFENGLKAVKLNNTRGIYFAAPYFHVKSSIANTGVGIEATANSHGFHIVGGRMDVTATETPITIADAGNFRERIKIDGMVLNNQVNTAAISVGASRKVDISMDIDGVTEPFVLRTKSYDPYDNTTSGLTADNVQDAIDENAAAIAAGGGSGITEVVEDLTPQLGGGLDAQTFGISNLGDVDITALAGAGVKTIATDNNGKIIRLDNISAAEQTAGTETAARGVSPAIIKDMIDIHAGSLSQHKNVIIETTGRTITAADLLNANGMIVLDSTVTTGNYDFLLPDIGADGDKIAFRVLKGTAKIRVDAFGGHDRQNINAGASFGYIKAQGHWYPEGNGEPWTSSEIAAIGFDYDLNAQSVAIGAITTWPNDGVGITTSGTGTATVIDEAGKNAVDFNGTSDDFTLGTPTDLDFVIGTDTGTFIYVSGTDGGTAISSIIGDRDATDRSINIGLSAATSSITQAGSGGQDFQTVTTGRRIVELVLKGATYDVYVDGVIVETDFAVGTDNAQNEWFIGSRGGASNWFDGSLRRVLIKKGLQLTTQQRTDVVAELNTIN